MKKIKNISKKRKEKSKKEKREINFSEIEEKIKQIETEKEIETEETEDFFEEPVRQIPISAEIGAPILERIIQGNPADNPVEIEQPREREERRIDYFPMTNTNYGNVRNEEREEKKYESAFVPPVLTRREIFRNEMKQEFLGQKEETWQDRRSEEQLGDIDVIENETRLPFEEQQKKYKSHRLR